MTTRTGRLALHVETIDAPSWYAVLIIEKRRSLEPEITCVGFSRQKSRDEWLGYFAPSVRALATSFRLREVSNGRQNAGGLHVCQSRYGDGSRWSARPNIHIGYDDQRDGFDESLTLEMARSLSRRLNRTVGSD